MKRVVIESPYAGDRHRHEWYLNQCLTHSIVRGEAPFASHRLYTGVLDDTKPLERKLGMEAGFEWLMVADLVALYVDLGISDGMREGIARRICPLELRRLTDHLGRPEALYGVCPKRSESGCVFWAHHVGACSDIALEGLPPIKLLKRGR